MQTIRRSSGFTLLEMLAVVAITAILLGLALSVMNRARIHAHEAATIRHLGLIAQGQTDFAEEEHRCGTFAELVAGSYVDRAFIGGDAISGYHYTMEIRDGGARFRCYADPELPGWRYFYTDGSIHFSYTGRPTDKDPIVPNP